MTTPAPRPSAIRRFAQELVVARARADRDLPHRDAYEAGRADGIMTSAAVLGILDDVERAIDELARA